MSDNNNLAIEVNDARRHYGHIEALRGATLQVPRGSIFGLLGSNGAGKSTLIKILVGSTRLHSGNVRVLGLDPFRQAAQLREQIGYMPQSPALYEDLSASANIAFFGAAHHLPNIATRVKEALDFTQLSARSNDAIGGFSGGMKQRVSLACALVHQPVALFLDEPTAGVDPQLKEQFWKHFRELARQGTTIFVTSHLMDEAMLCDQLAIMHQGKVIASDTPHNLMLLGSNRVIMRRNDIEERHTLSTDYPTQLPHLLARYGLDPAITSLELEQDNLEQIMLRLIDKQATPDTTAKSPVVSAALK